MVTSADASELPPIDAAPLVAEVDAALLTLLRSLGDEDWSRPTIAGAWTVRDVTAHLLDTALRRLSFARDGWLPPADIRSDADLIALINATNADGVRALGRLSPAVLISLMELATTQLSAYSAVARSARSRRLPRELGGRRGIAALVRRRPRAHRALAPPAADSRGGRHARHHDPAALPSRPRLLPPRASTPVSIRRGACRFPRADRRLRRVRWRVDPRAADRRGWRLIASANPASLAARATIPQEIAWRVFTKGIEREDARSRDTSRGRRSARAPGPRARRDRRLSLARCAQPAARWQRRCTARTVCCARFAFR